MPEIGLLLLSLWSLCPLWFNCLGCCRWLKSYDKRNLKYQVPNKSQEAILKGMPPRDFLGGYFLLEFVCDLHFAICHFFLIRVLSVFHPWLIRNEARQLPAEPWTARFLPSCSIANRPAKPPQRPNGRMKRRRGGTADPPQADSPWRTRHGGSSDPPRRI